MIIRAYKAGDWHRVLEIHDAARQQELQAAGLPDAFLTLEETYETEELFEYEIKVAEYQQQVAGFVAFTNEEVAWLYVAPEYQRKGIASALVQDIISNRQGDLYVEVLSDNQSALNFYKAQGFQVCDTQTGRMPGNESFQVTVHVLHQ